MKIPKRFTPFAIAFYMSSIMAFLMCSVITAVNRGVAEGYWLSVLKAYSLGMPIAFCCVLLVRPLVLKLVALTVEA